MCVVLNRFGYEQIVTDLNEKDICCLKNVMTLQHDARYYFDTLKLWFEPTVSNSSLPVYRSPTECFRALSTHIAIPP